MYITSHLNVSMNLHKRECNYFTYMQMKCFTEHVCGEQINTLTIIFLLLNETFAIDTYLSLI